MLNFLSLPYSHSDPAVKEKRFRTACHVAASMMRKGIFITSPIITGIAIINGSGENLPDTLEYWKSYCIHLLMNCNSMYVLNVEGWKSSGGVRMEIEKALELGIEVFLIEADSEKENFCEVIEKITTNKY